MNKKRHTDFLGQIVGNEEADIPQETLRAIHRNIHINRWMW
jgi:hypothetical protein